MDKLKDVYLRVIDSATGKSAVLVDENGKTLNNQVEVEITEDLDGTSARVSFNYLKWWEGE